MRNSLIILIIFSFLLVGCGMTDEEKEAYREWKSHQPQYSFQDYNAEIVSIDMRHWYASTHNYQWTIEVFCEELNLSYSESGRSSGVINAPSFLNKRKGDNVIAEVRTTMKDNVIVGREITRIR